MRLYLVGAVVGFRIITEGNWKRYPRLLYFVMSCMLSPNICRLCLCYDHYYMGLTIALEHETRYQYKFTARITVRCGAQSQWC